MDSLADESLRKTVSILGVRVHAFTASELHVRIGQLAAQPKPARVLNVNVNCLNLACERPWLRTFLNSAEVVFCDGVGVILGARLLGASLPERITYADWMWQLAKFTQAQGLSLFLLGAKPGIAAQAAERLRQRFPKLQIAGSHHGYFDKTPGHADSEAVVQQINAARPDLLIVGFGMPTQEQWLKDNWGRLDVKVALTGGAVFDYVSGSLARGPRWMTDHGWEWLARLIIEPRRLWRRYLIGNPLFLWRVLMQRFGLRRYDP